MSLIEVAVEAAHKAGKIIEQSLSATNPSINASDRHAVRHKGAVDLVTKVDLACETVIRDVLGKQTPDIPILAEEGGGASHATTRWIVDPLDGTTNFVHGFPAFAVSIGLQVNGTLEVGCIYDPLRDHTYTARRGQGAWCNGQRLAVSQTSALSDALLLTGFPYDRTDNADHYLRYVKMFLEQSQGLRRAGAAALDLAHIAAGRADGFWEFKLAPWDVAAGVLLVKEAGGTVTDMDLSDIDIDRPRILATNGLIHSQMAQIIAKHLD